VIKFKSIRQRVALVALALPTLLPLIWLLLSWLKPGESWPHLWAYVLPHALQDTVISLVGVSILTAVLGGALGWIQARYEFPLRKLLDVLLILPLAFPGFVIAYVWVGFGQSVGINVQGAWGGIFVYSFCLFPYVFVLVRNSAQSFSASLEDSAQLFGLSKLQKLRLVYLPLLSPALRLGVLLVIMETMADFGAANLLGMQTLTTSVYKTWFSLQDLSTATQLASLCALLMLGLLLIESLQKHKRTDSDRAQRHKARRAISGVWRLIFPMLGFAVALISVIFPLLQLGIWAGHSGGGAWAHWFGALQNSALLSALASTVIVLLGIAFALLERQSVRQHSLQRWAVLYGLGYGIPGTVLAVAVLLCLAALGGVGQYLIAGPIALILAYLARFARLGASPFAERLSSLSPNLSDAARINGLGAWARFRMLYLPVLTPSAFGAFVLVFVEILKELPASLVLRPIGWDTLAIRIYGYTSEGLWQQAATPSLVLVGMSALVIVLLRKRALC
jgi:iron(III) transport system permease protein